MIGLLDKILVVGRPEDGWVKVLAQVLENCFTSVVFVDPEHAFRTFDKESPTYVLVCNCGDTDASTPEAQAYRNIKILSGERVVLRCGDEGNGEDFLKRKFSLDDLVGKIRSLEAD